MKRKELLFKLALTAVFAALTFGLTFVSIPLPTGAKVHLGNFVCVLAGILCGGIVGGVSGSLGMGLNDIASGYGWNTTVRTFIVKFILGFTVGILFRLLIKRDKTTKIVLYSLLGVFGVTFIGTLIAYVTGSEVVKNDVVQSGVRAHTVTIGEVSKSISFSVLVPIFSAVLFAILATLVVVILVLTKKAKSEDKARIYNVVGTVTALSVLINLIGEFFLRWLLNGILNGSTAAFVESVTKIPSNLITGVVTIIAVTLVYLPVYHALKHAGYEKYIIPNGEEEAEEVTPDNVEPINEI